jgi:hypothetical protein
MGKVTTGGASLTFAVLALAQRLGNYENKPLAVILVVGACGSFIWFGVQLVRQGIDQLRAAKEAKDPHARNKVYVGFSLATISMAAIIVALAWRSSKSAPTIVSGTAPQICSPTINIAVPAAFPGNATRAQRAAHRHELIQAWRAMISGVATACPVEAGYSDDQVSAAIQRQPAFQSLRPYLSQEATRQLAKTTTFVVGAKIQSVLMTLQNDVDRIEREWADASPIKKLPLAEKSPTVRTIHTGPCSAVQVGGVGNTANGGNCTALPQATITVTDTSDNYPTGNQFVSQHDVAVSAGVIPKLTVSVKAASLMAISLEQQPVGFWTSAPVRDGETTSSVQNASGHLILKIAVGKPKDDISFKFICEGAECKTVYAAVTK